MFEPFLLFGVLLWISLAVAVGFHASGHDRNGFLWFLIVGIIGIFGLSFYILAITSADSNDTEGNPVDFIRIDNIVAGSVWGFLSGVILSGILILLIDGLNSAEEVALIPVFGLLIGAAVGPHFFSKLSGTVS
jgi:hypothetical protein